MALGDEQLLDLCRRRCSERVDRLVGLKLGQEVPGTHAVAWAYLPLDDLDRLVGGAAAHRFDDQRFAGLDLRSWPIQGEVQHLGRDGQNPLERRERVKLISKIEGGESVGPCNAPSLDRAVNRLCYIGNHFGPEPAGEVVLVDHQEPAGLADRVAHGSAVPG